MKLSEMITALVNTLAHEGDMSVFMGSELKPVSTSSFETVDTTTEDLAERYLYGAKYLTIGTEGSCQNRA